MLQKDLKDSSLYREQMGVERSSYLFICVLFILFFALFSFRYYWLKEYSGVVVDGSSMQTTLSDKDRLLMKRVTEDTPAKRGDVIVVDVRGYAECGTTEFLIKRLIATEGDKVKCEDGNLYVWYAGEEGYKLLEESYAYYTDKLSYDFGEYEVGAGEIFFLGDNRNHSKDSRYNEYQGSNLKCLYKATDIHGVVPQWAIEHRKGLEVFFFAIPDFVDGVRNFFGSLLKG